MNDGSSQPLVSIIIVSWNARDYLMQCLNSISTETCRFPFEIIVVDNASTDGLPDWVERQFPQVRLIRNTENLGFAKANNLGIAQGRGRYLALINSDVKVLPDCITWLVDYCEQHPKVGMVGPRVIGGDEKLQRSCRGFPGLWNMLCRALALDSFFPKCRFFTGYSLRYWPQDDERSVDILTGCFWLVRKEALSSVGLLDESFFMYGEDMDWCRRFWKQGWPVIFVPAAEAIHYGGGSSANAPVRFYIEMQRADLQYWKKHHSRPAVVCYYLISCLHLILRAGGYSLALLSSHHLQNSSRYKIKRSLACLKWLLLSSHGLSGDTNRAWPSGLWLLL
jgi:GT2 family glycosyltransferase